MIKYILNYKKIISVFIAFIVFTLSICTYSSNTSAANTACSYTVFSPVTGNYIRGYTLNPLPVVNNSRYVFGTDEREIDWSKSGVVKIITSGGRGTGFIINEDTIVTAAHCVYDRENQKGFSITDIKLFDSSGNETLNATPVEVHVPNMFMLNNTNPDKYYPIADYAMIRVDEDLSSYACFNLGVALDSAVNSHSTVTVTGFPGEVNGQRVNNNVLHNMYTGVGVLTELDENGNLKYTTDSSAGNSGGPVYIEETRGEYSFNTVIAIHVCGADSDENAGTTITTDLLHFYLGNQYKYSN